MADGTTEVGGAHIGLAVTVIAVAVVALFSGPLWALITTGCFVSWFVLMLVLIRTAEEGREALRRAYVLTFGWGDYVSP
ncbi:hypothetical protein [Streptomyces violaceorubidus]|uniref:Uncharacterized protein n=1 Tax=Streptomyces violaceorubidus TaxID=284042 RepID=A0ABV1T5T0_9ACTN